MKKTIKYFSAIVLLMFALLPNQKIIAQVSYEMADSIAANFEEDCNTVAELAQKLTTSLDTDEEKARVFYMWLTNHVSYDCRRYHKRKPTTVRARTKEAAQKEIAEMRFKRNERTMKRKTGICDDYSRLFKALCDEVGVEAVRIVGNARDFHRPFRRKHKNPHAWNAVKIDGTWRLLDATWGAGYTNAEVTKFSRRVTDGFFFTRPDWFAQRHFPDDEKWQLLDEPLSKEAFSNQAIINVGQNKYPLKNFSPQATKLEGKKKSIWFEFEEAPGNLMLTTRTGKHLKFTQSEKDGKTILTFKPPGTRNIVVYAGKLNRRRMEWLAKYEL